MMRFSEKSAQDYIRKFTFYILAKYNFESRIWKSGGFEINEKYWTERNETEPKYPILNDRLRLTRSQWSQPDHIGAVYCGDEIGENEFTVR